MVNQRRPGCLSGLHFSPRFWGIRDRKSIGGGTMTFMPVMWVVWSLLVLVMAGLYLYRSSLTKDEEDQIFLDDSFDHERNAQAAIVAKVNKLEPVLKLAYWLVAAMTVVVIVYYIWDILVHLDILS
jgi:hypothetical protein